MKIAFNIFSKLRQAETLRVAVSPVEIVSDPKFTVRITSHNARKLATIYGLNPDNLGSYESCIRILEQRFSGLTKIIGNSFDPNKNAQHKYYHLVCAEIAGRIKHRLPVSREVRSIARDRTYTKHAEALNMTPRDFIWMKDFEKGVKSVFDLVSLEVAEESGLYKNLQIKTDAEIESLVNTINTKLTQDRINEIVIYDEYPTRFIQKESQASQNSLDSYPWALSN